MIADKVYPSFYVIELEGKATKAFVSGDFGIDKIAIGSLDYKTDLEALSGLTDAMSNLLSDVDKTDDIVEEIVYNPEFFPTLKPLELTEEQKANRLKTEEVIEDMQEKLGENQVAIPLTNDFDPLGDFVEARWTIKSTDFKIEGKVAVNPQHYLLDKQRDTLQEERTKILIH